MLTEHMLVAAECHWDMVAQKKTHNFIVSRISLLRFRGGCECRAFMRFAVHSTRESEQSNGENKNNVLLYYIVSSPTQSILSTTSAVTMESRFLIVISW